jgi:hypothetical protein
VAKEEEEEENQDSEPPPPFVPVARNNKTDKEPDATPQEPVSSGLSNAVPRKKGKKKG